MNKVLASNIDTAITKQAKRMVKPNKIKIKLEKHMYKLLIIKQMYTRLENTK